MPVVNKNRKEKKIARKFFAGYHVIVTIAG